MKKLNIKKCLGLINPFKSQKLLMVFWLCVPFCAYSAKYKVCSITINSSDEIKTFKSSLNPKHFDFVELVPLSQQSRPNDTHWFTSACEKNIKCDVLVISGHFGGLFFGKKHNYILPVNIMERRACNNTCPGILSHVKEVFLFGCNTLANKQKDNRSPEEYLQVLLSYNYAYDMAEIMAASRYLPFGLSFEDQMRLVFAGQSHIYGWTSLSPLGPHLVGPLKNYFQAIKGHYGSYKAYLDQKDPSSQNPFLHQALGGSVTETTGLKPHEALYPDFQKMCHLYNKNRTKQEGLKVVKELLTAGKGPRAYYAIKSFMSENQPFNSAQIEPIFNSIRQDNSLKAMFSKMYAEISPRLAYTRIQFLNFLNSFEWVPPAFHQRELKQNTLKILVQATSEAYDFVMALIYDEKVHIPQLGLRSEDFPPSFYSSIWSPLILEQLKVEDYLMHRRLMNLCLSRVQQDVANPNKKPVICYQVFQSLGNLNVSDNLTVQKIENFLNYSHDGLIYYAIYSLARAGVQTRSAHLAISQHFNHRDWHIQRASIWAVGHLRSQNEEVNRRLVKFIDSLSQKIQQKIALNTEADLKPEEELLTQSFKALSKMNPEPLALQKMIKERQLEQYYKEEIKKWALFFGSL